MPSILVSTRWLGEIAMRPNSGNGPPPTSTVPTDRCKTVVQTLKQVGADAKQIKKAAGLSKQGMDKSQVYGISAVGADPKTTSAQKSNMATASGVIHKGSSRKLAIEWVYGTDA